MSESKDITPKTVQCLNCHKFWELEETESKSTVLTCPSCNKTVDMSTLTDEFYTIDSGNIDNKEFEKESTKTEPEPFKALSYLVDLTVFFILLFGFDAPFLAAFIISGVIGWSIRAVAKRLSLNDEGLPEDILCPQCGADLKLSKAERTNKKFTCSKCKETFDVVD